MKKQSPFITLLASLALVFAILPSIADASIQREFEESIDLSEIKTVHLQMFNGTIKASGGNETNHADLSINQIFNTNAADEADDWDDDIERTIEKRGDKLLIAFKFDGNNSTGWFSFRNKVKLETQLLVPAHIRLVLETKGGHIETTDLNSNIKLNTSGGNIEIQNIQGDALAHTSGGHIDLENIQGSADVNTSGGNISAKDVSGDISLKTSGGHIKARGIKGVAELKTSGGHIKIETISGELRARTSGGSITATFNGGLSAKSILKTSGGTITVQLPMDENFDLEASTSGGRVNNQFAAHTTGTEKKRFVEGKVRNGGPRLELKTSGGNIHINSM